MDPAGAQRERTVHEGQHFAPVLRLVLLPLPLLPALLLVQHFSNCHSVATAENLKSRVDLY